MKSFASGLLLLLALAASSDPEPQIAYFSRVRDVSIPTFGPQKYLVIDSDVWLHARSDLADLRLYDGSNQVPYQLMEQRASSNSQPADARIFNLVRSGDHTEFDLAVEAVPEYNRICLNLNCKNFLVRAWVSGRDALSGPPSASWPTPSTLFDFSRENLGSNTTITLPTWSFRYVHVRLSAGIAPDEVKRVTVDRREEKQSVWTDVGTCRVTDRQKRTSLVTCALPPKVPAERIRFDVSPDRINFRRNLTITNGQGVRLASAAISRIRMHRGGSTVTSENLAVTGFGDALQGFTITLENGDDPPLAFTAVQPQSLERRLYFDPPGRANLKLYYGDEKLGPPVYDYAKFFAEDAAAVEAKLGPDIVNPAYAGRPDVRPWSERHRALLWLVMMVAVAVLTALALRGLESEGARKR